MTSKALLVATALLMAPAARAQLIPPDFSVPGQVEAMVEPPGEMWVEGTPTRFRAAMSTWKKDELFRHYFRLFEDAGFYIPPEEAQLKVSKSIQLTAVDIGTDTTHTVVLSTLPNGLTSVILGEAAWQRHRDPNAVGDLPALPPGAMNVLRTTDEGMWNVNYDTPASEDAVYKFYDTLLPSRGFRRTDKGEYLRQDELIRVYVKNAKPGERHVMLISSTMPNSTNPHDPPSASPVRR